MGERKKHQHIQWEDRLKIEGALRSGARPPEIAKMIGCCRATIYNEINRGQCVQQHDAAFVVEYCADVAERKYQEHLRAKGPEIKLGHDFALAEFLEKKIIEERFSPGAALAFIKEHNLHFETELCENTVYNYIYRGDVFLNLTTEHLLYKGKRHKPKPEQSKRARMPKGESIEKRPQEVQDRETFGNWEMDSVMGPVHTKPDLVVLTERLSRYGIIVRVPDHTMASVVKVINRLERKMGKDFRHIFTTITVDNGGEFQDCEGIEKSNRLRSPRTKVYYCHPYSAYERGSNENMNGIIRRFFPKGTNFEEITDAQVAEVENWLNNYPRKILGWRSAASVFQEHLDQIQTHVSTPKPSAQAPVTHPDYSGG